MLQLIGRPAHSAFRLEKLLTTIQKEVPAVLAITSEYRYFVEVEGECVLPQAEMKVVEVMLEAETRDHLPAADEAFFLVIASVS